MRYFLVWLYTPINALTIVIMVFLLQNTSLAPSFDNI